MELAAYEALDDFCPRRTGEMSHRSDVQVFRASLRSVVHQQGFSPDETGPYSRNNHAQPVRPKSVTESEEFIQGFVREARAALSRARS
jgi:hypothetical protein